MSDAVQIALIAATLPAMLSILSNVVTHLLSGKKLKEQDKKLDTIEKLSNSTLSHVTEKKEAAEHKLEQTHAETVAELKAKLAEKETTIGLLTNTPPAKESGEVRPFKPEIKEGGLDR